MWLEVGFVTQLIWCCEQQQLIPFFCFSRNRSLTLVQLECFYVDYFISHYSTMKNFLFFHFYADFVIEN